MGPPLEFALDDQAEGRALNPADGKVVGSVGLADQRNGAGEGGAPDQVDVLTGRGGVGQRVGEVGEVGECALDLFPGQGGVAGAANGRLEIRVDFEAGLQGLEADQLALTVEVGGDDQAVGGLGLFLDRLDHVLLAVGRPGDQRGVDQAGDQVELPLLVLLALREGALDGVASGSEYGVFTVTVAPPENRHRERLALGRGSPGEDLGDLLG